MRNRLPLAAVIIPLFIICLVGFFFLPPIHDRLVWKMQEISLRIGYTLHPPEKAVFVPTQQSLSPPQVTTFATEAAVETTASATSEATFAATDPQLGPAEETNFSLTPTPASTPIPGRTILTGVVYEDQHGGKRNYCAPANLAMALSYWDWQGNQDVVGPVIKPEADDKNVMPYEMADYIHEQTNLGVVQRVGGDTDTLRRFLAAGYPILLEKGVYFNDLTGVVSWMGHYQIITGYDDAAQVFISQDSFIGPDHETPYDDLIEGWRAFNYIYLIVYPPEREQEIMTLLGPDADETVNFQNAALKASNEIYGLSGIDQYFAWFNRGSSLVALQDYGGAAAAYDESFKLYPSIPENERPWRMLWYQTGPYFAYFGVQRYYDLLFLADSTLNAMQGEKNLEESYFWRGRARAALGDNAAAIEDFRLSLKYHPGFEPAIYQLGVLGADVP